MVRTVCLLTIAALVLGLTACNDSSSNSSGSNAYFGPGSAPNPPPPPAPVNPLPPNDDHGNDAMSATFMQGVPPGGPANGSGGIDYALDEDWFQIYIDTTGANNITFATTGAGDTFLALIDSNGNTIASNDDEDPVNGILTSKIELMGVNVPPTGFYFLVVAEGAAAVGSLPSYGVTVTF